MKYFKKVLVKIIINVKKLLDLIQMNNRESVKKILHVTDDNSQIEFCLISTNELTKYRATTFSTKEPETLRWIDEFGGKGVFYDIGANIGLYSIYNSLKHPKSITIAFEPSSSNLRVLTRNISINNLILDYSLSAYSNMGNYSIKKGAKLIFLLENGETIEFKCLDNIEGIYNIIYGVPTVYNSQLLNVRRKILNRNKTVSESNTTGINWFNSGGK